MQETRITLEIRGIERIKGLIKAAKMQAEELEHTVRRIESETLEIQTKINQPLAATDD